MMKILGREDMLNSDLKNDRNLRRARMGEIREAISEWTKTKDKMEVFHTLAKQGIPAAPILDTAEVLNDTHFNERGMIAEFNHARRGKFKMPGCPIRLSKNDYEYKAAPLLGEHNSEVYKEWMNFTEEDLAKLKTEKIV
jgi:formyl-CoA transferase